MFKLYALAIISILVVLISSCKNSEYKTHESGLKYRFITEKTSSLKPNIGDVVALKMKFTDSNGSIIEESGLFKIQLKEPSHKGGCIEDAISLMSAGDSIIFVLNTYDFYTYSRNQEIPENIINTPELTFHLKLVEIIKQEEFEKNKKLADISNKRNEEAILSNYIKQNNIKAEPSLSGMYFIELKKGEGKAPQPGKMVSVHYNGYFLSGEVFDSSYERDEPFQFYFGIGKVIQGLDEGVSKMKVGGKYKLIIPSYLAYGDQQVGPIPPNSTLVFEIELLNCEQ